MTIIDMLLNHNCFAYICRTFISSLAFQKYTIPVHSHIGLHFSIIQCNNLATEWVYFCGTFATEFRNLEDRWDSSRGFVERKGQNVHHSVGAADKNNTAKYWHCCIYFCLFWSPFPFLQCLWTRLLLCTVSVILWLYHWWLVCLGSVDPCPGLVLWKVLIGFRFVCFSIFL